MATTIFHLHHHPVDRMTKATDTEITDLGKLARKRARDRRALRHPVTGHPQMNAPPC
jgi:hypothetical protein